MIICPWCGTNYLTFQPNCKNCGGSLHVEEEITSPATPSEPLAMPPAPPRLISDKYVWRLLFTDGWAITALIFGFLGVVFGLVGAGLSLGIITAFVGIPFLLMGIAFFVSAAGVFLWRHEQAQKVVNILRLGQATPGRILDVQANYSVRINGRHPWVIRYQFQVDGQDHDGSVTTLNLAGQDFQAGNDVCILYLPTDPKWNAIYPHP